MNDATVEGLLLRRRRRRKNSGSSLRILKSNLLDPVFSIFFALLLLITLAMGSAAPLLADFAQIGCSLLGILLFVFLRRFQKSGDAGVSAAFLMTLLSLSIPALIGAFVVYFSSENLLDYNSARSYLRSSLFFLIMFWLAYQSILQSGIDFFLKCMRWIGFVIAIIALAHWLQDNGKLFGLFDSLSGARSLRARWPFVNANHLAHYLLAPFFVSLALFFRSLQSLSMHLSDSSDQSLNQLARKLSGTSTQQKMMLVSVDFLFLLSIMLALVASQSRSAWLAALFGLFVFLLLLISGVRRRADEQRSVLPFRGKQASLIISGMLSLVAFVGLALLFSGRGSELVEQRLQFGMSSSLEDLRWTMYSDSLPLLYSAGLRGIGAGGWRWRYPALKSEQLTNFTPHYLHSDPYQFLIEMGVLSFLPFLIVLGVLTLQIFRARPRASSEQLLLISLICAALAVILAACFDFPLRLPALQGMSAALLAGLLALSSNTE